MLGLALVNLLQQAAVFAMRHRAAADPEEPAVEVPGLLREHPAGRKVIRLDGVRGEKRRGRGEGRLPPRSGMVAVVTTFASLAQVPSIAVLAPAGTLQKLVAAG